MALEAGAQAALALQELFRSGGDRVVHPVAGSALLGAFEAPPLSATREVFETNTFGVMAMTQAVAMARPDGQVRRKRTACARPSSVTGSAGGGGRGLANGAAENAAVRCREELGKCGPVVAHLWYCTVPVHR